jgi:hypothetical protein
LRLHWGGIEVRVWVELSLKFRSHSKLRKSPILIKSQTLVMNMADSNSDIVIIWLCLFPMLFGVVCTLVCQGCLRSVCNFRGSLTKTSLKSNIDLTSGKTTSENEKAGSSKKGRNTSTSTDHDDDTNCFYISSSGRVHKTHFCSNMKESTKVLKCTKCFGWRDQTSRDEAGKNARPGFLCKFWIGYHSEPNMWMFLMNWVLLFLEHIGVLFWEFEAGLRFVWGLFEAISIYFGVRCISELVWRCDAVMC